VLPQLESCPILFFFATSWNRVHRSTSAQSSSAFHRLFRNGAIFFTLFLSLHNVLFNSAPPIKGTSRNDLSWQWGDVPSLRRVISVGASVIQAHGRAQGRYFQASFAHGGFKTSAVPPCLGPFLLCGVSNPYKRQVCCWLRWEGCSTLVVPFSPLLQVPCCLPSHRVLGLTSPLSPPSPSLRLEAGHLERHCLTLYGEMLIQGYCCSGRCPLVPSVSSLAFWQLQRYLNQWLYLADGRSPAFSFQDSPSIKTVDYNCWWWFSPGYLRT